MPNITQITPPRVPIVDQRTNAVSREWYRWFYNIYYATGGTNGGATPTDRGGTGTTQVPTNGQILVGNGSTGNYNATDLGVGDGIGKTLGTGTITIENTGVLSFSAGTTGLTPATATTGDVVLDGILGVVNGGTGQSVYDDGELLIGNSTGNTLDKATLTAGAGITITNGPGSITIATTSTADQESQTATSGQTVFTLTTMTYVPGSNTLSVFVDGVNQILTDAYVETSSTVVTFTEGLHVGAKVRFATV